MKLYKFPGIKNRILISHDTTQKEKIRKRILVTGNPRSGTHTIYHTLRQMNVEVGHEQMDKDGTVSCFFFYPTTYYPYGYKNVHYKDPEKTPEIFNDYYFITRVHLVRHPLKCIRSMYELVQPHHHVWHMYHGICPRLEGRENKLRRIMHIWFNTNLIIESYASMRIRIEDGVKGLNRILKALRIIDRYPHEELPVKNPVVLGEGRINKRFKGSKPFTWDDLKQADENMCNKIKKLAKRYGYDV